MPNATQRPFRRRGKFAKMTGRGRAMNRSSGNIASGGGSGNRVTSGGGGGSGNGVKSGGP